MFDQNWQGDDVQEKTSDNQGIAMTQNGYEKYKQKLQTIKRPSDEETQSIDFQKDWQVLDDMDQEDSTIKREDSQDFEMEQVLPDREEEKEEYIITQDQHDSVSYNSKLYESPTSHLIKPQRKEEIHNLLSPITKQSFKQSNRKYFFKSVDINQQLMKYEQITYVIESYQIDDYDEIIGRLSVSRTYTDFEWFFNTLFENFPGIIIPSIPTRSVLAKLNISVLTASIRAQRQKGLDEFLRKVQNHQVLKHCEILEKFFTLSDQDFKRLAMDYQSSQNSINQNYMNTQSTSGLIGDIISTNLTTGIFKIRNYMFGNTNKEDLRDKQINMEEFFLYVEKESCCQQSKVKLIKESMEKFISKVQEQMKQYQQMSGILSELEFEGEDLSLGCEHQSQVLREIINKFNCDIIYILEFLWSQRESKIFRAKQRLRRSPQAVENFQQVSHYLDSQVQEAQKAQVSTQLNQHQLILATLIDNFKREFEYFSKCFNSLMNEVVVLDLKYQSDLSQQIQLLWNY